VAAPTLKLLHYCQQRNWSGHDPYDALNSPLFRAIPILDHRIPRLVATQVLKRSPVNVRRLLLIPETQNPKAMGLFLTALVRLSQVPDVVEQGAIDGLIDRIVALRSADSGYWCWGYSFPWQARTVLIPRGMPNLVCTTFVANALLDAHAAGRDERCLDMATSAAHFIARELYWTAGGSVAAFKYPHPSLRVPIHNANFLGAALLSRVSRLTGDQPLRQVALNVARYSASRQRADGSWAYGEAATQQWIDNFHTGYNLCALRSVGRHLDTDEFEASIRSGLEFYLSHFFDDDGAPRYYHNRTHPIDIHSVAQSIITLLSFRDARADAPPLARKVFEWAMANMWDDRGFFYYRALRLATIRTSYMRWSQAWMLHALALLWNEASETDGRTVAARPDASAEHVATA
jgi:hypothetical protein